LNTYTKDYTDYCRILRCSW